MPEENLKISMVIITYNRPDDMLDLARNISQLKNVHDLTDEIIIVNNRSTVSYAEVEKFIDAHPETPFKYYLTEENLGVSRGRNYAIQRSKAPVLVFLDDDALFQNDDALQQIKNIFTEDERDGFEKGIISFKVYYHSTMELQQTAFPHKQFAQRKNLHHFQAPYFVGCAHAIKKKVFDATGLYPENFFYGMEEYDLSYRTLNAGFSIVYDDRVVILHKESPEGRLPAKEKLRGMWVNKSKVAWKFLPRIYFYTTSFLWSFEYLAKSKWHFKGWFKGFAEIRKIHRNENRTPISKKSLSYLKKNKARLWY